ncbi:hypothetical protein EMCRGX_G000795, partial [Ephydatia muelleri]
TWRLCCPAAPNFRQRAIRLAIVFLLPILQSKVDLFSEYFNHWDNYTSTTAFSINLNVGFAKINGKFSDEYNTVKSQQVNSNSKTTRVQVRNRLYTIKQQPDSQLHPTFKSRLVDIARNILNQNMAMASYLAELLVREYGTHYVNSVEAGAVLMQTDHISSSFVQSTSQASNKLTASASSDFLGKLSIDVAYDVNNEQKSDYSNARTSSQITSIGGPLYRTNMTLNEWEAGVPNALVAIDRSGDPLYICINPTTLPDLPPTTVMEVANLVYKAINRYYKMNTVFGCAADPSSPNFNFQANIDDGSCKASSTNFAFGGVFQTCMVDRNHNTVDLCPSYVQTNPLTGDYSCPTGYTAVNLHNGTVQSISYDTVCNNVCHKCGWFRQCCQCQSVQVVYVSAATYQAYWCAPLSNVGQDSGFLFGGVFSSYGPNPVTVCATADHELGYPYSLPFGGFDSCVIGNPLAASASIRMDIAKWPHQCPQGYSQHVVALDEDCEIDYCVKTGVLSQMALALNPIKLPPFRKMPFSANATNAYVHSANGEIWTKGKDNQWLNNKYGPSDGISVIEILNTGVNYSEYTFESSSTPPTDIAAPTMKFPNATATSAVTDGQNQPDVANQSGIMAWVSVGAAGVAVFALVVTLVIFGRMACKRWRPWLKRSGYSELY